MKDLVIQVLSKIGFMEKRASKLDVDDFLQLLNGFNAVGIHFT